jgi:hypothetical protein
MHKGFDNNLLVLYLIVHFAWWLESETASWEFELTNY